MDIYGPVIDNETRCIHYHTEKDIIAIKFKCCNRYYPCYKCHEEHADHSITQWPKEQFDEFAILCGCCHTELTIQQYMNTANCPHCGTFFNERCALHYPIYFERSDEEEHKGER
ncbi:putative CHY-type Zn-finger protein [Paenibacillus castaneae]|uniref:CHY zinc finger protein n=1 Tax=Paenibacillus castaneae TaxID=474957 RepID=UPI000C9B9E9A|nr:CHY zinc finger protein [Paenibacillus castaneae]NIK76853.1 putative CHY-type Zn-finger protein [Paenibacillus castaneae]